MQRDRAAARKHLINDFEANASMENSSLSNESLSANASAEEASNWSTHALVDYSNATSSSISALFEKARHFLRHSDLGPTNGSIPMIALVMLLGWFLGIMFSKWRWSQWKTEGTVRLLRTNDALIAN